MTRLLVRVPASSVPRAVTTRCASGTSRRRCWQEGAAPPPYLRRLRSTPPVSLRSARRVPACRAVRSVPRDPGLRAPPDRCPCHRHARASGIARRRNGSRPRPARPARAERHSAGLPPQSCRSRHGRSGADLASGPRLRRGMLAAVGARVGRELVAKGPDRDREIVTFDGRRSQALHRVAAFGDRLRRLFNRDYPVSLFASAGRSGSRYDAVWNRSSRP